MSIRKKSVHVLILLMFAAMFLPACRDTSNIQDADVTFKNRDNEAKAGGSITYGYSSPFEGWFEPAFYKGEDDFQVLEFMTEPLFKVEDDLSTAPYIASWQESADHRTFTFKIKPGVRWHNGDELTVEDWKFALETIADPDYMGSRYYSVEMIQGVEAYHAGKANEISGIKVVDPYTLKITVTTARVNTIDSLWPYPMNKKYYSGVAVKDMPDSEQMRKNPIGIGPFKVIRIDPGEKVVLQRFDKYHQGKPLLDGIVYKVFDEKEIVRLFRENELDIAIAPRDAYENLGKLDNIELLRTPELSYEYIGFKFGHWDTSAQKIVMDNPKFSDKRLRQAMYYALNRKEIIKAYSHGLGLVTETPIPESSWAKIPDSQINTYSYNPGMANRLLDEAGYADIDGDGYREDRNGQPFIIHYDGMSGSTTAQQRTEAILQDWRDVGLNVQLNGGALKEMNAFYDAVEEDDPTVELFNGVWGLGSDPDPSGLWRDNDLWNYPRWSSKKNEELIRAGISMKAYEREYRRQVYYDWQKLINEEVPMIFVAERENIVPVSKRLQGVTIQSTSNIVEPYKWWIQETD